MSHDYVQTRLKVDRELRKLGLLASGYRAFLRRGSTDREVVACIVGPRPNERAGSLYAPEDRKALLSALDIDGNVLAEPSKNDDMLVVRATDGTEVKHKIQAIPGRSEPGGIVVMWKLQVRRI